MTTRLEELRRTVLEANLRLAGSGLVLGTFGNVSGVDRVAGLFVIKPSGVPYTELTAATLVPVSLKTGEVLDGKLRPSSDTPTHLELYRAFGCGGIAHTHAECATAFAQARQPIRCMGTTHADFFRGDVPVTRPLTEAEVAAEYELNTGRVIVETFRKGRLDPAEIPGVLVANHGPFTWGDDAFAAVERALVLEQLARMEIAQRLVAPDPPRPDQFLVEKHFGRKHGKGAYYGQKKKGGK
ncbi:MAG TPA: L-ribulose-5-phosphate 4-epimerase AraD [Gemmatimonadales bacterium]|nr:L-ribulose-5-phosphate 4-epimerase AraD [Gemmatimonadales bacterium]